MQETQEKQKPEQLSKSVKDRNAIAFSLLLIVIALVCIEHIIIKSRDIRLCLDLVIFASVVLAALWPEGKTTKGPD